MNKDDLEKILAKHGCRRIRLRNQNLMATCPNHPEDNPSWGININEPHVHGCFSCGFKGNLATLLKRFNYTDEQISDLCELNAVTRHFDSLTLNRHSRFNIKTSEEENLYPLKKSNQVSKFLCGKRKIPPTAVEQLELYYNPNNHSVVFPHRLGKLFLGATERLIAVTEGSKTLAMFDLHKRSTLYAPSGRINYPTLIVVEGEIDAIKVFASGFPNVAALCFGRITQDQIGLMLMFGVREVILFFDHDILKSGEVETPAEKFTRRAIGMMRDKFKVRVAKYPRWLKKTEKADPASLTVLNVKRAIDNAQYRIGLDSKLKLS